MQQLLKGRGARGGGVLFLAFLLVNVPRASAQERFGGLTGRVTDSSHAAVPGATVTATNRETNAGRSTLSDSGGIYRITDLTPGRYDVSFELPGFQKVTIQNVLVILGRTFNVDAELQVGGITETVNVTADVEKQIDLSSVTISHNVTAEELDLLPKARSFTDVALMSPSVNRGQIEGGLQVNGASGAENAYTLDGVTTNSLLDGSSRQNTVFEYIQEVQVKTAGVDAEYGGALGGVISAVTKSGGNTFHGEAHYYYFGNALSAGPVPRIQLSPLDNETVFYPLQDAKQSLNQNELGGSIGGPILPDRLFFFGSISPRVYRATNNYKFDNGNGTEGSISVDRTYWQAFGKLTYSSARMQANVSLLMTPTRDTGRAPAYDGLGPNLIVSSQQSNEPRKTQGYAIDQNNVSADVNIWLGQSNYVTVKGGYFSDNYKDTGIPTTTSYRYQRTSVGAPNIPPELQGPIGTQNVPRSIINNFDQTKREYFEVNYNHAFSAGGTHSLKGGVGYQHAVNDVDVAYPGGYVYIYWNSVFPSPFIGPSTGTYGYYRVTDYGTKGKAGGNITSMFIQDTWAPIPRLTLNLGVRTEHESVPTFDPNATKPGITFGFGDKVAPRLGATYDVLGDGRMKLYGSWGRYYDWTKYTLSRGIFGGDFYRLYYYSLDTLDIGSLNLNNLPGTNLWPSPAGYRDLRLTTSIDPNLKPMYQDSTNLGWEYQFQPSTVVGIHYVHNKLGRTIEDLGEIVNGDFKYRIINPGEGEGAIYHASYPNTPNFNVPKPKRLYDALELTISRRFSRSWFVNANYTYSRLRGNYAGLGNSDEISTPTTGVSIGTDQQQSGSIARPGTNGSLAWDTDTYMFDSKGNFVDGRLATDRPHVFKLYGAYQFDFGTEIGLFLYAGSGTPVSTQVNSLDQYPLFVNNRGDIGRTPALSHADLLVSHEFNVMGDRRLRLELQVINLFNQKTATHIFNFLNKGAPGGSSTIGADAIDMSSVNLLQGYDYNALILETPDGQNAYDPRYKQPDLWQPGTQGQFSVKFIF